MNEPTCYAHASGVCVARRWHPIETAPTMEAVLVFVPGGEHYGPGIYRAILTEYGWQSRAWAMGRDFDHATQPTHWKPLPDPPGSTA